MRTCPGVPCTAAGPIRISSSATWSGSWPWIAAWERLAGLFGYRLRPELGATFGTLAPLLSATLRGLVIMALSMPEIAAERTLANPFGAAEREEWSLPAIGLASIASSFLEPDPAVQWDGDRIAAVREALAALTLDAG